MTPIEAMAKAYHENDNEDGRKWSELRPEIQAADIADMRAALLALAEMELDDMMVDEAPGMIWGTSGDLINMATNNFRAICRALAEQS
jgi:hypothetical protein